MRRRAASPSVSSRAREAVSWCWLSAFKTAVATSSVKSAILDSVFGGKRASRLVDAAITPHVRPPTTIGQPTDDRIPSARASRAIGPDARSKLSTRAGRPVSSTFAAMLVALQVEARVDRQPDLAGPAPGRDPQHRAIRLEALHSRDIGVALQPDLPGDGVEDLRRRDGPRDERGDPAQGRLLGLAALAIGHVTRNGVHQTLLRDGPRRPLEPAHRSVAADVAVLELDHLLALGQHGHRPGGMCPVLGMDQLEERP